jgi:hypothetical protein
MRKGARLELSSTHVTHIFDSFEVSILGPHNSIGGTPGSEYHRISQRQLQFVTKTGGSDREFGREIDDATRRNPPGSHAILVPRYVGVDSTQESSHLAQVTQWNQLGPPVVNDDLQLLPRPDPHGLADRAGYHHLELLRHSDGWHTFIRSMPML